MLKLAEYRDAIQLDEDFPAPVNDRRSNYDLLMTALSGLKDKHYTGASSMAHLSTDEGLFRWLHAELAIRKAGPIDPITSRAINTLLYRQIGKRGRVEVLNLRRVSDRIPDCDFVNADDVVLYRGDILEVVADAVVNTALSDLSGCPIPLHGCLDSVIHGQAGPWLKNDAAKIMALQGKLESPGSAKITRGYRLPAKYIIHTHMPRFAGEFTNEHKKMLAACYRNSLNLALEKGDIKTIAFPAIGTGMNGFPKDVACKIALDTVEEWWQIHPDALDLVVFSVQSDVDSEIYFDTLSRWVSD